MIIPSKEQLKTLLSRIDWYFLLQTVLVFAAFIVPLVILYFLDAGSFDYLWKGRAPYFLFLWLLFLEAILGWKNLKEEHSTFWTKKTVLAALILLLPTVYATGLNFGLNVGIVELGKAVGVPAEQFGEWYLTHSWLFSFEYILFASFFVTSIWLLYGAGGLKTFAVSSFFIGGVGVFYMIDTFYPYGTFTILQSFVPVTVSGATYILNFLGYGTRTFSGGADGLGLIVTGANEKTYRAIISWSCAGSHSLFLYSFMIMLFLRGTSISRMRKIIYVVVGAVGTFLVNILRIVAILLAGVNGGASLATTFHEFYGEFFFIAWMFIYLSIIFLFETRLIAKTSSTRRSNQSPMNTTTIALTARKRPKTKIFFAVTKINETKNRNI
jgi:thaumarchaeosortase